MALKIKNDSLSPPLPPSDEPDATFMDYVKLFRPHHMKALIWKNFLWMWRNVGVMLFIIGLPCLQIILFCWAIGHDPRGLKIAVSNHELSQSGFDDCPVIDGCNYTLLSCRYLNVLRRKEIVIVSICRDNELNEWRILWAALIGKALMWQILLFIRYVRYRNCMVRTRMLDWRWNVAMHGVRWYSKVTIRRHWFSAQNKDVPPMITLSKHQILASILTCLVS